MKTLAFLLLMTAAARALPTESERLLLERIEKLEQRLAALEAQAASGDCRAEKKEEQSPASIRQTPPPAATTSHAALPQTSVNMLIDGYYSYNFNRPEPPVNALRAYDVSHNSFSLNQADIVIERSPDVAAGQRLGGRIDLMFGQATEALQGSSQSELRPQVYRHIFQAYGTYIVPVGRGLTVNFGKWASPIGIENNYTKDQINYSRSFLFNLLPFYHMGLRTTYPVNGSLNVGYWLVNGRGQSEDFNGFKSQAISLNGSTSRNFMWTLNYYVGREQRTALGHPEVYPRGRARILDGYASWEVNGHWTLAAQADLLVERTEPDAPPQRAAGAAGYVRYRVNPRFSLGGRFEYLDDRGGLFSGRAQVLREATATATFDPKPGFQIRWEYRRDWSNAPFFAATGDQWKRQQETALVGLIWWLGDKRGAW